MTQPVSERSTGTPAAPRAAAVRPPRVREVTFEDYDQIATLQAEYGRPIIPLEQWKHYWVNNPAYIPRRNSMPMGWVLELEEKKIVGYLGNIPLFCELGGQRILACVAHAWVVDVHYRTYSLALLDLYFSQKSVELFLNATVGAAGFESFGVFESLRTPVGDWDRSAFWITNYQGFIESSLIKKKIPLAKPLSYAMAVLPQLKEVFSNRSLRRAAQGVRLQVCNGFDERFDTFWELLKERRKNVLLSVRTRDILEWHFRYALQQKEAWIVTAGTDALSGYGIFLRHDNPTYGLKRLRLIDFQALDGSTTLLLPMMAWAFDLCRKQGVHMLECIGFRPEIRKIITSVAPYQRQLPCWLYFYKARDKGLAQKLADPKIWDPSQFDGDASL